MPATGMYTQGKEDSQSLTQLKSKGNTIWGFSSVYLNHEIIDANYETHPLLQHTCTKIYFGPYGPILRWIHILHVMLYLSKLHVHSLLCLCHAYVDRVAT